jgi:hypothetical protein
VRERPAGHPEVKGMLHRNAKENDLFCFLSHQFPIHLYKIIA